MGARGRHSAEEQQIARVVQFRPSPIDPPEYLTYAESDIFKSVAAGSL
jgi:hypothetical protein